MAKAVSLAETAVPPPPPPESKEAKPQVGQPNEPTNGLNDNGSTDGANETATKTKPDAAPLPEAENAAKDDSNQA